MTKARRTKTILAADLFCGAGGTSKGLRRACTRLGRELRLRAINHWPTAIESHKRNEPDAEHICERLERVDPRHVVPEGELDILIASPECTHHSRARGGKPISDQQRASAWIVLRWAEALYVRRILIENVPEFTTWGPLNSRGQPIRERAGETYHAFLNALRSLGYHVDAQVLTAADYGDPTTRKRLFIQAERRRRPRWPEPTHAPRETAATARLAAWRGAREIVDWSIPGQSIFTRRKPLAEATLRRIEAGLRKFGGATAEPFLVILRRHSTVRTLDDPAPTVTTSGAHLALVEPFLLGQQSGAVARPIGEPAPTITTGGAISLIQLFLFANRTHNAPRRVEDPIPALCTGKHIALVEPQMVQSRETVTTHWTGEAGKATPNGVPGRVVEINGRTTWTSGSGCSPRTSSRRRRDSIGRTSSAERGKNRCARSATPYPSGQPTHCAKPCSPEQGRVRQQEGTRDAGASREGDEPPASATGRPVNANPQGRVSTVEHDAHRRGVPDQAAARD